MNRRYALALVALATGGLVWWFSTTHWALYPVRWAFPALGFALALAIASGVVETIWQRRLMQTLASGAAIAIGVGIILVWWNWLTQSWSAPYPFRGIPNIAANVSSFQRLIDYALKQQPIAFAGWGGGGLGLILIGAGSMATMIKGAFKPSRQAPNGPWQSKWMTKQQAIAQFGKPAGLPLGLLDGKLLRYEPNQKLNLRSGHHALLAAPRAGKGVSGIIPAILDHEGPLAATDIKGELYMVTRRHRESLGRKVAVLNPFGLMDGTSMSFNPLSYIRKDHMARDINVIADGLIMPESDQGEHYAKMARLLVAAGIEVVLKVAEPEKQNLETLLTMLLGPQRETTLRGWIEHPETVGERAAQIAQSVLETGERERGGFFTTLEKSFAWMSSDEMRKFLRKSEFNLDDLLDDKLDLFIVVPLDQVKEQAIFMRLFVNLVLGTFVRQTGKRLPKARALLVLDEFVRLGRMEQILNIATVGAGVGIDAFFILQDKGQLDQTYGRDDANTILSSAVTTRIFGLGRTDIGTARWVESILGDQTLITESEREATKFGGQPQVTRSEQRSKLMSADQILELPSDEMICFIGSRPPLRLKKIVYYEHKAYRGKHDPNPTVFDPRNRNKSSKP